MSSGSNTPSNSLNVKKVAEAQKLLEIARSRAMTISEILQYDLLTSNSLFEGQSPSRPDKNKIVTELQNILEIKNSFENRMMLTMRWLLTLYPRIELY